LILLHETQSLSVASIKRVFTEVQDLVTNPPEDIRVQLNEDDITDIAAYIRGPGTPPQDQFG
jgi:ubiquitin-conjugating enzyme E2 S